MNSKDINQLIEIINNKTNIVDIINEYIKVEKKGANYWALCPFHDDVNPSMSISFEKKIFKCFSCGVGGNVVHFLQRFKNISFIESIKLICEQYSIDYSSYINIIEKKYSPEEEKIFKINQETFFFYQYILNKEKESNEELKKFLNKRSLEIEQIEKYSIGFAPRGESLYKFLLKKGFTKEEINFAGLINKNDNDYFQNRLIFAIIEEDNFIYGFSGRNIEDDSDIKYLNSRENVVFKKRNIVWNINNLNYSENKIIIFEGFMDVISWEKNSNTNVKAIALMGLNLNPKIIKRLKKITKMITLGYDNDIAGINNTILSGNELIKNDISVFILSFMGGKDIDEHFKIDTSWNEESYFLWFINQYLIKIKNINQINNYSKLPIKEIQTFLISFKNNFEYELMIEEFKKTINLHKMFLKQIDRISDNKTYETEENKNVKRELNIFSKKIEINIKTLEAILEKTITELIKISFLIDIEKVLILKNNFLLSNDQLNLIENLNNVENKKEMDILINIGIFEEVELEIFEKEIYEKINDLEKEINLNKMLILKFKNDLEIENDFHKFSFNKIKNLKDN